MHSLEYRQSVFSAVCQGTIGSFSTAECAEGLRPRGEQSRGDVIRNLYAFEDHVERYRERLAITYRPRYRTVHWTYRDLALRVQRLAVALRTAGVKPGDRVALYAPNSPYWVASYFGILGCGGAVVPLNPRSTPEQLNRIVTAATPQRLLVSLRSPWPGEALPLLTIEPVADRAGCPSGSLPGCSTDQYALAELVYTSGTTGEPKGVMLTHDNLLANVDAVSKAIPLKHTDHLICLVPLFHMYGLMTAVLPTLAAGCSVTYLPSPSSRLILETLATVPATVLIAVPEVLKAFMDRLELSVAPMLSRSRGLSRLFRARLSKTLRTIVCGGAPLDLEVERKWRELGFEVLQGYGLTETSPGITLNTPSEHRTGSVGKPLAGVEVRIAPDGEILVRSRSVTPGYYRNEALDRAAFTDGWFRTGDIGRFDDDGFLYVLGRRKYMILGSGGENVFPEDIEAELNKIPGVKDSAVVGLEEHGRTVIHVVLLCDGNNGESTVTVANRHLAPHQHIMGWSLWPEADFPRSATRKVKKDDVIRWINARERVKPVLPGSVTPLRWLIGTLTAQDPRRFDGSNRLVTDLALDSLLRLELVTRIEEELNVYLEETQITPETTLSDLEALITAQQRRAPRLTRYPRWSLSPWAGAVRPAVQRVFFYSWLIALCRLGVRGTEYLEDVEPPVIFLANHRSFLDAPLIVRALPHRFRKRLGIAAATDTLYARFWWFAPLAELAFNAYPFPAAALENIKPGLDYTGRILDLGWNVLVFPEGRLNRGEAPMQPLKHGTGLLAVEMQCPVVPVVILGTEKILPPDTAFPTRRGPVEVRFGPPMRFGAEESYRETTERVYQAMRALIDAPSAQAH